MKGVYVYHPPDKADQPSAFIDALDPRLRTKIIMQLYRLTQQRNPELKEPHFKRFSIERYRELCELRVKSRICVRIVFYLSPTTGDVLLLYGFVKRQKRDTMQALEQSLKILDALRKNPECAVEYKISEEER